MTDDNQTQVTPDNLEPEFGKGDHQPETKQESKFSTEEIEKILKQNTNARSHIETLESETAQMRAEIKALQEQMEKSRTIDDLINTYGQQGDTTPGTTSPLVNEQELLAKLKAELKADLSAEQLREKEEQNWRESLVQAKAKFGEKYASYVDQKAQDLGIPVKDMESYARTSPKVFMELLGGSKSTSQPSPTYSSQTTSVGRADDNIEIQYSRYVSLRKQDTPEGREAKRILQDPGFMERYRLHILSKAK